MNGTVKGTQRHGNWAEASTDPAGVGPSGGLLHFRPCRIRPYERDFDLDRWRRLNWRDSPLIEQRSKTRSTITASKRPLGVNPLTLLGFRV